MAPLKTGPWKLSDLDQVPKNGLKVFSCFHCGGGSTMGYKLAGYEVLGGVEIDPEMMDIYKENHSPEFSFLMGVEEFNKKSLSDIPKKLLSLDILDGSPPCSSFSMAGSREKSWGKNKKFREGQATQVLDDLFFHFIETARILQPKVVIAENVKGLLLGKAKGYVKQIAQLFHNANYDLQLYLLNAAFMGVPQKRERVFFIASRKDLQMPRLGLKFNEQPISAAKAFQGVVHSEQDVSSEKALALWQKVRPGSNFGTVHPEGSWFSKIKLDSRTPSATVTGHSYLDLYHWERPRNLAGREIGRLQSFPDDFNFLKQKAGYVCGMSVPPYMMQRVANQIELQWLSKDLKQRTA